jgi:hypothetical protein
MTKTADPQAGGRRGEARPNRTATEGQGASALPLPGHPDAARDEADAARETAEAAGAAAGPVTTGAGAAVAAGDLGVEAAYKNAGVSSE